MPLLLDPISVDSHTTKHLANLAHRDYRQCSRQHADPHPFGPISLLHQRADKRRLQ